MLTALINYESPEGEDWSFTEEEERYKSLYGSLPLNILSVFGWLLLVFNNYQ
jgi:hypothetical protein